MCGQLSNKFRAVVRKDNEVLAITEHEASTSKNFLRAVKRKLSRDKDKASLIVNIEVMHLKDDNVYEPVFKRDWTVQPNYTG